MKTKNLILFISLFFLLCIADTMYGDEEFKLNDTSDINGLIILGDSLSDQGNFFHNADDKFPAEPFYEGRFTDGPLWVEYLAEMLNLEQPKRSFDGGTNFACACATSGVYREYYDLGILQFEALADCSFSEKRSELRGIEARVSHAKEQVDNCLQHFKGKIPGDQLIVLWIGGNDFIQGFLPSTSIENIKGHIKRLAQAGGKYFLVPNFPPFEKVPLLKRLAPRAVKMLFEDWFGPSLATLVDNDFVKNLSHFLILNVGYYVSRGCSYDMGLGYNYNLSEMLFNLEKELGVNIIQLDLFNHLEKVYMPGNENGIHHVDSAVIDREECFLREDPHEYVYFDGFHPTTVVHRVIAESALLEIKRFFSGVCELREM